MTEASQNLERQIQRIHSLLEGEDSLVTWDDRIRDPDNEAQFRQIDVSIKRDNALTLVECRIHAQPQDVTWIEELIGRRLSLQADAIIAVSASGFTRGAILKAKAHGVVLRDMKSLSEAEIRSWGQRTAVSVELHHFAKLQFCFIFSQSHLGAVSLEDIESDIQKRQFALLPLLDKIVEGLRQRESLEPGAFFVRLKSHSYDFRGCRLESIEVTGECWHETVEQTIAAVVAYDTPETDALSRNVYVEIVEQGRFEIAQSSDQASVAVDIASIMRPRGCKLGQINFRFARPVELREVVLLGEVDPGFFVDEMTIAIEFR